MTGGQSRSLDALQLARLALLERASTADSALRRSLLRHDVLLRRELLRHEQPVPTEATNVVDTIESTLAVLAARRRMGTRVNFDRPTRSVWSRVPAPVLQLAMLLLLAEVLRTETPTSSHAVTVWLPDSATAVAMRIPYVSSTTIEIVDQVLAPHSAEVKSQPVDDGLVVLLNLPPRLQPPDNTDALDMSDIKVSLALRDPHLERVVRVFGRIDKPVAAARADVLVTDHHLPERPRRPRLLYLGHGVPTCDVSMWLDMPCSQDELRTAIHACAGVASG